MPICSYEYGREYHPACYTESLCRVMESQRDKMVAMMPPKGGRKHTFQHQDHMGQRVIKMCFPFYISRWGKYIHRVRSATHYTIHGKHSHTSISFWCGNLGSIGGERVRGTLLYETNENDVHCAICEGKAIGAGQDGARTINGRNVMFSPRK